ncbi:unnamed protein product [Dovyalis caffra]|uniref:Uncharacterized protein n=1 Tax=Dovyalis caffra TaxID=77055 RepID=A0AAV1SCT7_9ROSI|nr:unnamed protein product [Dovyalis caffra]
MALIHSSFATSILLLSLLVIASAGDCSYDKKPDYSYSPKSKPDTLKPKFSYDPKPQPNVAKPNLPKPTYNANPKPNLPKPKLTVPKPGNGYDKKPHFDKPTIPKPETVKPNYGYDSKPDVPKPKLTIPKPHNGYDSKPHLAQPTIPKLDPLEPNYGYDPKPDVPKPKLTIPKPNYGYDSKPKLTVAKPDTGEPNYGYDTKPNLATPKMTVPKPDHGYDPKEKVYDQPKLTTPKPEMVKPHAGYGPKPKLNIPKPSDDKLDYPIGIEGFVLCKQSSSYTPIKGAVIRIACIAVDQYGYKKTPFSFLTEATNARGYFFKTLPAFGLDDHLKITECKAYLESSPLKTCNVPTDMNYGIAGPPLSSYHLLHDKKMKLYSMRTFFYTSTKPTSTPAGDVDRPTKIALTPFLNLYSPIVIASAGDYGYDPKPDTVKPETSCDPKPKPALDTPTYEYVKKSGRDDQPTGTIPKTKSYRFR